MHTKQYPIYGLDIFIKDSRFVLNCIYCPVFIIHVLYFLRSLKVFKAWGYVPVYACSWTLMLACFVWMVVVVRGQKNPGVTWAQMAADFCKLDNFVEGVRTTIRPRLHSGRNQILLMLGTMCIIVLNAESEFPNVIDDSYIYTQIWNCRNNI